VMAQVIGNQMGESAPEQQTMGNGVMVYQNTSPCCRCCCCQPNIDWTIHDFVDSWSFEMNLPTKMFMREESAWIGRCMSNPWPAWRATKYTVYAGGSPEGPVLFTHEKPYTCSNCPVMMYGDGGPVRCPCCFCLPYLETRGPNGELLGTSKYVCDECLFVPKFDVLDSAGQRVFRVRPDTCVGGLCVKCRCGGGTKGKCFRIPFPIRKPEPPFEQIRDASITDLWAGMRHECCTNREMYAVKFPIGASGGTMKEEDVKKVLIGTTLLVDLTLNEQDQ